MEHTKGHFSFCFRTKSSERRSGRWSGDITVTCAVGDKGAPLRVPPNTRRLRRRWEGRRRRPLPLHSRDGHRSTGRPSAGLRPSPPHLGTSTTRVNLLKQQQFNPDPSSVPAEAAVAHRSPEELLLPFRLFAASRAAPLDHIGLRSSPRAFWANWWGGWGAEGRRTRWVPAQVTAGPPVQAV